MNYGEAKASSHGLSSPGEPGFLGLVPGSKPRFTSTFWAFACLILGNAPLTKSHDQIQMTEVKYMLVLDGKSLRVLKGRGYILKRKGLYPELGFTGGSDDKESICSVAALGSISRVGRSTGGGHGNPLQYSCLENPPGQRSLAGCSPWGRKESDMTEQLSAHTRTELERVLWAIHAISLGWIYPVRFMSLSKHWQVTRFCGDSLMRAVCCLLLRTLVF